MTRTIITAACALALSTSFAMAQPSQAQGGGQTGPTSNSATSDTKTGGAMMKNDGMMKNDMKNDMKKGSTSGMSGGTAGSTTGSGMTGPAGQNTK